MLQQHCFIACAAKLTPLRSLQSLQKDGSARHKARRQVKSADRLKGTEAILSQKRRQLQQKRSNQFNACPTADYIYSGPTMDSIFDELSVDEFQTAVEYVVRYPMYPIHPMRDAHGQHLCEGQTQQLT